MVPQVRERRLDANLGLVKRFCYGCIQVERAFGLAVRSAIRGRFGIPLHSQRNAKSTSGGGLNATLKRRSTFQGLADRSFSDLAVWS